MQLSGREGGVVKCKNIIAIKTYNTTIWQQLAVNGMLLSDFVSHPA